MNPVSLSEEQLSLVQKPLRNRIFLEGPAGTGKTTTAVERLLYLMSHGVRGDSILLMTPQRTLAGPYYDALRHPGVIAGTGVPVMTVNGLAQRMLELFWPLAASPAGFALPDKPPVFLTLETAQYFMARVVQPMLQQGHFEGVALAPNRLYSQILDNLNKAASVGFSHTEIASRLKAAWLGEPRQLRVYEDAQEAALRFRQYCLGHNLLDFSLQLEVFLKHLWVEPLCRDYLRETFRHLIADNIEEDVPVAHDLLAEWLPNFESALLVYDQQAGYRSFLGADPNSAVRLKELCDEQVVFSESYVTAPPLQELAEQLGHTLLQQPLHLLRERQQPESQPQVLIFQQHRYYPQMIDWVATQISRLVQEDDVLPRDIAVLVPFLSDALRFSLTDRLEREGIPVRSHRPSRTLREEPATRCLLTLAAIAHPGWSSSGSSVFCPTKFDVAYALLQAIDDLDLVRAQLLSDIVYRVKDGQPKLSSFDQIQGDMQERITYLAGERYEILRGWLQDYSDGTPDELDHFLSRLFGEVLSQPGFRFHQDYAAGEVAANLVDSARAFRWAVAENLPEDGSSLGQEYLEMVQQGVVAAQYIRSWQFQSQEAVLLAPAYTFLMYNRPVRIQFWLDISSRGWFERLYQPLTHPHVLSRRWEEGKVWTDHDELTANQNNLHRLTLGLLRRCQEALYLGLSDLNEQGYEQQGPLLKAFNRILRQRRSQADGI